MMPQKYLLCLLLCCLIGCHYPKDNHIYPEDNHLHPRQSLLPIYRADPELLTREFQKRDIEIIRYGATMTLIVPIDKYFEFGTPEFSLSCYKGLNLIVELLKAYPKSKIFVAGFTDSVGSERLIQEQTQAMVSYLWANDIPAKYLAS